MKNLIKRAHFALYILLTAGFLSCTSGQQERETLDKYPNWVVIEKIGDGTYRPYMYLKKGDIVKKVYTYDYYQNYYQLGDTVKACR